MQNRGSGSAAPAIPPLSREATPRRKKPHLDSGPRGLRVLWSTLLALEPGGLPGRGSSQGHLAGLGKSSTQPLLAPRLPDSMSDPSQSLGSLSHGPLLGTCVPWGAHNVSCTLSTAPGLDPDSGEALPEMPSATRGGSEACWRGWALAM